MTPTIPVELYRPIIEQITTNRDLCSVARSSAILQLEAERIIYRSIGIKAGQRNYRFINSVISHPHRHHLVRTIDVRGKETENWTEMCFRQSSIPRLVARLLRMTTNLEVLKIRFFPGWILYYANHLVLKSFSFEPPWRERSNRLYGKDYPPVIKYLQRHPSITELALVRQREPSFRRAPAPSLSENEQTPYLPLLHTLYIKKGDLPSWIRDKQLKRFYGRCWQGDTTGFIQTFSLLSMMGDTLVVLDLTECSIAWHCIPASQGIEKIGSGLPLLRYLGLPTPLSQPTQFLQLWEADVIHCIRTHLPMLLVFRMNRHGRSFSIGSIVPSLFAIRDSLKWIVIGWPFRMLLNRREEPQLVSPKDAEFQRAMLELGVQVMESSIRLVGLAARGIDER